MTTRRQWGMALMAVGLAIGWAGAGVADAATGGLRLCQANLATCTTTLATCDGELTTCTTDLATRTGELTTCNASLGTCNDGLDICDASLGTCNDLLAAAQKFPATGQTSCWDSSGTLLGSGAGTGHDGEIQAGATLAYTDNDDGTITDNNTKLMWEKKSDDESIHDKDTTYTWANAFAVHIAGLNAGAGFAGHTDWRFPNVRELPSIVNYENVVPAVSSAFNTGCAALCTVLTCSCTQASGNYWSSSTSANNHMSAWFVNFASDGVGIGGKSNSFSVRAVRGGL